MKLGWVHDWRLSEDPGGAQKTNKTMVANAPSWAEIVCIYPGEWQDADAYIVNNVRHFPYEEMQRVRERPYIVYEHDHWTSMQAWQQGFMRRLFTKADAMVFLSPMHRDNFLEIHGCTPKRIECVPSPVEVERFCAAPTKSGTAWLGAYTSFKGIHEAVAWAALHGPVDFFGWGPDIPKGPGVRLHDYVEYEYVPLLLSAFERFLFLPVLPEAFARTVAEAALSGCELICNDRVGAMSWGWHGRDEWAAGLTTAPADFWAIVGDVWHEHAT